MAKRSRWEGLPTEAIHPEATRLHAMAEDDILALLAREDRRVVRAVETESPRIKKAARAMARSLGAKGRVFYVGAGTSGRLGVLEASECPPTYGTDPSEIVAIMAGGRASVFRSKEGAEDREDEAKRELHSKRVGDHDLVVGISASSVTPFVRGALAYARGRGVGTVLVTCGRRVRGVADVVIAPQVGPEVLAGSTRMKAGTATKLVLNQMTLLAMIRLKKIFGPYMVDVRPTSAKLKDRAIRMVQALAQVDRDEAERLLRSAGYDVRSALETKR